MNKIAKITKTRKGRKKVIFSQLSIYEILRNEYEFRFQKIRGKGYYFQKIQSIYNIVGCHQLRDTFVNHLELNYEKSELNVQMDFEDFMNEFYHQRPINRNPGWNDYLAIDFTLSEVDIKRLFG